MTASGPSTGSDGTSHKVSAEASVPWHSHNWDAILAGEGFADRYFLRAGLVRKDRLTAFVPQEHQPQTAVVRSSEELAIALEQLGESSSGEGADDVRFVLKKAQSSNASGMRFFTGHDACAVIASARHTGSIAGQHCASASSLACSAAAVAAAAVLVADAAASWRARGSGGHSFWTAAISATTRTKAAACTAVAALTSLALSAALGTANITTWLQDFSSTGHGPSTLPGSSQAVVADLQQLMSPDTGTGNKERACIWVIQRHIEPWLHCGRKFHLRVLLLCVGDLQAYVHQDVRMLVATELFKVGKHDTSRVFALVTNMGASGRHEEYDKVAQNLPLETLGEELSRKIFSEIGEVLGATLMRVRDAGRRHFFTTPNCWELFGADFLVEGGSGRVILLELNPSPSMAMYGDGGGPAVRRQLLGTNPLEDVPTGWCPVPLVDMNK